MIKTILVPTDGSVHAGKAVQLAADIAGKYAARMVLLNILPQGPLPASLRHMAEVEHLGETPSAGPVAAIPAGRYPASMALGNNDRDREVYEAIGRRVLDNAKGIAKKMGVAKVATVVEDGDPVQRILDRAEQDEANLIVMGSRGLSDLKGLLMGSVSHKVSHLAKCSCITVR